MKPHLSPEVVFEDKSSSLDRVKRVSKLARGVLFAAATSPEHRNDQFRNENNEVEKAKTSLIAANNALFAGYGKLIDEGAIFKAPFAEGGDITATAITRYTNGRHASPDTIWSIGVISPEGKRSQIEAEVRRPKSSYEPVFAAVYPVDSRTGKRYESSLNHEGEIDEINTVSHALSVIQNARQDGTLVIGSYPHTE